MLVVMGMILVAIGAGTASVRAETAKETGGILTVAANSMPSTVNPLNANDDEWIMNVLYDSLAVYKPTEGIEPWLATGWTVASDNVTVNVTLRSEVTFTDGTPMTAADVVYSYEQYMSGTGYYHNSVSFIKSVQAIDDTTVQFVLNSTNSDFFTKALLVPIVKQGSASAPVGTGPFMGYTTGNRTGTDTNVTLMDPHNTASRKSGNVTFQLSHSHIVASSVAVHAYQPILFEGNYTGTNWSDDVSHTVDVNAVNGTITIHDVDPLEYIAVDFSFVQDTFSVSVNPNYFMGRPYVDGITFVVEYNMDSASVDDINQGRVDVILNMVNPYYKSVVQGMNSLTPLTTTTIELRMNCESLPLNNSDFRKAISYAIDKNSYVSQTLLNSGLVGDSVIPRNNMFWYNSSLQARPYSISEASAILSNAGFVDADGNGYIDLPDGTPFSLTVKSVGIDVDNYIAAEAQVVSEVLKNDVGINNTWVVEAPVNVTTDMNAGNFDMVITRMSYPLDPSYLENFVTGDSGNFMHYSNANFDAVMEKANAAMDITLKQKYIKQAQGILYDDTATIVLTYLKGLQYYNGASYEGYYSMINGINNKFSFLNVYHTIHGSLSMAVVSSSSVISGNNVSVKITVNDNNGNPVEGAKVEISATAGTLSATEVTTDSSGKATVTLTAPDVTAPQDITISARASKAGYVHAEKSTALTVKLPAETHLAVSVTPTTAEVGGGNTTTLTVTVTANNQPVAGATVSVEITPSTGASANISGVTDSNGQATITFHAPKLSQRVIHTVDINAHMAGYSDPVSPAVATITVTASPASAPTANVDKVPGFEAVGMITAISLAMAAIVIKKRH